MKRRGVFGNQAMGQLPSGIFGQKTPLAGLGEVGGIFSGPTALGTALGDLVTTVGSAQENCAKGCAEYWGPEGCTGAACHDQPDIDKKWSMDHCLANCALNNPPKTEITPDPNVVWIDGTPTEVPADFTWGNTNTSSQGLPCNSDAVIRIVQRAIGAGVDGDWGPESQSKLKASGQSFQAFAPGCTGSVPSYSSGGGYTPPPPPPPPPGPGGGGGGGTATGGQQGILDGAVAFLSGKFMGLPVGVWGVGLIVVVATGIAVIRERG